MDIYRMQKEAEDRMTDNRPMLFTIVGPLGEKNAEWLDPYFGMFTIDGMPKGSMVMVKQFANVFPPLDFVWRPDPPSTEMG